MRVTGDSATMQRVATHNPPDGKPLQTTSFVVHATRGLIRDQKVRRVTMIIVLTTALFLMILGSTVLQAALNPHEHPGWFIFFWLICAWLTVTAMLLAVFDLLMLRANARRAEREIRADMEHQTTRSPVDH